MKVISSKEQHRINKESFERRMEAKWREIVEDEKARAWVALDV